MTEFIVLFLLLPVTFICTWKRSQVYMEIFDVIETEEAMSMRMVGIGERVKAKIEESIQKKEKKTNETELHTIQSVRG